MYDQLKRRYNSKRKKIHCSFKNVVKKIVINITKLFSKMFKAVNLSSPLFSVDNNYVYVYTIHILNSFLW